MSEHLVMVEAECEDSGLISQSNTLVQRQIFEKMVYNQDTYIEYFLN